MKAINKYFFYICITHGYFYLLVYEVKLAIPLFFHKLYSICFYYRFENPIAVYYNIIFFLNPKLKVYIQNHT